MPFSTFLLYTRSSQTRFHPADWLFPRRLLSTMRKTAFHRRAPLSSRVPGTTCRVFDCCWLDLHVIAFFLPCLDVMQEVQKYFKILLWKKKKKMGFVKIKKKNIFSRTGLTGSLSPQRASRLFALTLSYISVRRCAIPVSVASWLWPWRNPRRPPRWPDDATGHYRDLTANTLIQYSTSVYIYV